MYDAPYYRGSGKLQDKVAIVTDGDSGIGRSVAVLFARERPPDIRAGHVLTVTIIPFMRMAGLPLPADSRR